MSKIERWIDLSVLPKKGSNEVINWENTIGYSVPFKYGDFEGNIEILDFKREDKKAYLKCKINNKIDWVLYSRIPNLYLEDFIIEKEIISNETEVETNSGRIKIKEFIPGNTVLEDGRITKGLGYKYDCCICNYKDGYVTASHLKCKRGCPVCAGQLVKGHTDLWTVLPSIAKLLVNEEGEYDENIGYSNTKNSNQKVNLKCPYCGNIERNKILSNITRRGFKCSCCGDNTPKGEQILISVFNQLGINYLHDASTEWSINTICDYNEELSGTKRYDFIVYNYNSKNYIQEKEKSKNTINLIIEINGGQHYYQANFNSMRKYSKVEYIKKNDKFKKELALKNGIDKIIYIDSSGGDFRRIVKSIKENKEFNELFNIKSIDWDEIFINLNNSELFKKFLNKFEDYALGKITLEQIGKELGVNREIISRYKNIVLNNNLYEGTILESVLVYKNKSLYKEFIAGNYFERYQKLINEGYLIQEAIAELKSNLGVNEETFRKYVKRYKEENNIV